MICTTISVFPTCPVHFVRWLWYEYYAGNITVTFSMYNHVASGQEPGSKTQPSWLMHPSAQMGFWPACLSESTSPVISKVTEHMCYKRKQNMIYWHLPYTEPSQKNKYFFWKDWPLAHRKESHLKPTRRLCSPGLLIWWVEWNSFSTIKRKDRSFFRVLTSPVTKDRGWSNIVHTTQVLNKAQRTKPGFRAQRAIWWFLRY